MKCDSCKLKEDCAMKFCQAQEQKEYQLLEAEHSILLAQFSKVDLERLELKKKVEALERDNFELSAGCCTELLCDDGGNPTCKARIETESLKKKLEKAEEVIRFYGDKENWLFTGMYCNTGKHKITDRMQAINGWNDQHKSIVNSDIENHSDYLMFGGKKARAYLKENEG